MYVGLEVDFKEFSASDVSRVDSLVEVATKV